MANAKNYLLNLLEVFRGHLKYTFGSKVEYIGTTANVDAPSNTIKDVDVMIVLADLQESHIVHLWRIIRRVSSEYNIWIDARIISSAQLDTIPIVNKYLLKHFLSDLLGENPFKNYEFNEEKLKDGCIERIREQGQNIVNILPRIASNTGQLRLVGQYVYDAIRAYLVCIGKPCATKELACTVFTETMPSFSEANEIYKAYLDPDSVVDISEFIISALALVKHIFYKTQRYELLDRVVLVNSPSTILSHPRDDYLKYDQNMPLGLVCVASFLRDKGVEVEIVDCYAENLGALSIVDRIFNNDHLPRIIGFNACSPNIHVVHKIAGYIKRIYPDITIVCGGPHATLSPAHTLSLGSIDFSVVGEGEYPFLQLIEKVFNNAKNDDIPGIYRLVNGKLIGREPQRIVDLSLLPIPDFKLLPVDRYFAVKKRIYIHTTRGCAFKCIYCSVPECMGQKVTCFSVERMVELLREYQTQFSPDEVQVVDDNFSHNKGTVIKEFCEKIALEAFTFKWKCQARADQLDVDLVRLMKASGCFEIDLGIESGNKEIQRFIRKGLDLQKTSEVVGYIAEADLIAKAFFMLGFPMETYLQLADTINYAIRLKGKGLSDVAFFPVMPFPGTEIAKTTGKTVHQGAIIDEARGFERSFASHRLKKYAAKPEVSLNSLFTPEELRLLVKFAYVRFETSRAVHDLQIEFEEFLEKEEAELYAN